MNRFSKRLAAAVMSATMLFNCGTANLGGAIPVLAAASLNVYSADDYGLAEPALGKTYTADFAALDGTNAVNGMKFADDTMIAVTSDRSYIRNDGHGFNARPGDKFVFKVAGNAKIKLTACVYGRDTWTLTDSKDNVIGTFAGKKR